MRIGVLGTGFGKFHARIYKTIPGVEIIGIAGRAQEKTIQAVDELGIKAFLEMEELISDPRVDIIDVCLSTCVHEKYAVMALNAGKHVFCETPLAYSLPETERIMHAAEKNKKHVYM
jgi:UDP-N-acetylglucosamine 3-dehydrogenase